jgi:hypothetical protein
MGQNTFGLNDDLARLVTIVWGTDAPVFEDYSARERDSDVARHGVTGAQISQLLKEKFVGDSFQDLRGLPSLKHYQDLLAKDPQYQVQIVVLVDKGHTLCHWVRIEAAEIEELPTG